MLLATLLATAPVVFPTSDRRQAAVIAALGKHLHRKVFDGFSPDARLGIAFKDLNNDGREEAVVFLDDRNLCGSGGCVTFVFMQSNERWSWVSSTTLTNVPIYLLPSTHHGWRDVGVSVRPDYASGGSVALRFDGRRYTANPTAAPVTFGRPRAEEIIWEAQLRLLRRNR